MNLDIYTTEMSKSVWDKAFFMDKIPGTKCVIDFGCADGAMIRYLAPLFPDIMFIGFDINEELIARARSTVPYYANNIFFGNYNEVIKFVKDKYTEDELCINFSSVLHEVFSSTPEGKESIRAMIQTFNPKYITIRDMYWDWGNKTTDDHLDNVERSFIINQLYPSYYSQFVAKFGHIHDWEAMTHFLMKYQWRDNGWDDELEEDYYAWKMSDFFKLIETEEGDNCYDIIFENHYMLPYLMEKWLDDPGFFIPEAHTHAQFILRRND